MKKLVTMLCAASTVFAFSISANAANDTLTADLARRAAIVEGLHKKASRALVTVAQDGSFSDYFYNLDKPEHKHAAKSRIEKVSLNTQEKFYVEEMCLISKDGPEIARIVGSEIAPDSDLSEDESAADFFAPGFATDKKKVYISQPYMSPDVNKWVVAYVTPVVVDDTKEAILHYEHGLDVYQKSLGRGLDQDSDHYVIALDANGYVLSDSRRSINVSKEGEKENLEDYFQKVSSVSLSQVIAAMGDDSGSAEFNDNGTEYDVSYKKIKGGWTLVAVQKK